MSKRPTIHDVAALAGVSKSTAAVVFSSPDDVSPARRERVLAAAAELGYTPNAWARSLRSTSSGFVGIIVADLHNPLFTEIADAARQLLASQGIFSFVSTASIIDGPDGKVVDPEPIQHLLDLKPASLFIVGGLPDLEPFVRLSRSMTIVVALSSATELPKAVTVRTDESLAMRAVCEHLAGLGHRRVTYVGPLGRQVAEDRLHAFQSEAQRAGLDSAIESTGTAMDESSGTIAAVSVLSGQSSPTAIVCYNDNVAFGVQNELARREIDDVAVTGFDNTYIAQLERVSLTSIAQNIDEIVRRSCEVLSGSPDEHATAQTDILIEPALVVRNSTSGVLLSS
jgi:DNA-binding LacI/PurR family transcriptional regulator